MKAPAVTKTRKRILLLLALAALVGGVVWWANPGKLRIEFVEFRDVSGMRVGVFNIVNDTAYPRAVDGRKLPGWEFWVTPDFGSQSLAPIRDESGAIASLGQVTVVPPRTSTPVTVEIPAEMRQKPFTVATRLISVEKYGVTPRKDTPFRSISNLLRAVIGKPPIDDEMIVSDPVQDNSPPDAERGEIE